MRSRRRYELGGALLVCLATVTLADQPADGDPVFTRDVAPIIYRQCTGCHRPQGAGPFDLLTYEDARKRARQLVEVTRSGFMPPWQPEAGYGEFVGERRLSDDETCKQTERR